MNPLSDVAVIIPVGPGETAWPALLKDLELLPRDAEIILVGSRESAPGRDSSPSGANSRWIDAATGRARQLNAGADATQKKTLWFVHADCRVPAPAIEALRLALIQSRSRLLYFDLEFLNDGPRMTRLNAAGARIRSRAFGLPFGDQGFCVSKENFDVLGQFPEDAPYGEDHLFVWKAKRAGVQIRTTGSTILTSARKYRDRGWIRTTLIHWVRTGRQAIFEWSKCL